jgi:hypothetical protein
MTADREGSSGAPASGQRDLDLPLVDGPGSGLWAEAAAGARDRGVWPALAESLTEKGRQALWDALRRAVDATPDDPDRALMVVEAFWRTMQVRRGPDYERRMAGAEPSRVYGPGELRRDVEARVRST